MDTKDLTTIDAAPIDRLQRSGTIIAGVGLVLGAIGVVMDRSQFAPSWLIGLVFCTGLSLGSLALLMTYHMTGGNWGHVARRCFEAGAGLLPYCALLFIPVAIFVPVLYPWAGPESATLGHTKATYLSQGFFIARSVIYFAVWTFMAMTLRSWSFAQDRGEVAITEADTRRFRVISAPGLLIYVVLMSLAAIDWVMSLDPHWYSTIFGFIFVAGQALCALSFAVAVLAMLVQREPMNGVLKAGHFHDLGKLMLAFTMLWAYFSFSQFLIIWAGNLPEEITFYLTRLQNGWQYVSLVIVFGHFILPFCLLLSADLKRRPRLLARVAWFIVAIRLVDIIWLVSPDFNQKGMPISAANVGIPLLLAGVWLFLFAGQLRKHPLVPVNDPYFKRMLAHGGHGGH
jgi:hypothetical protein